jgi:hypothetical protein
VRVIRIVVYGALVLQLLAAGIVLRKFWPRAVEAEDVALIRVLPGNHGDMIFTNATILQLMDGDHQFGTVSAPNTVHALLYISHNRTNVIVSAGTIEVTGVAVGYQIPSSPWWEKAWRRARR